LGERKNRISDRVKKRREKRRGDCEPGGKKSTAMDQYSVAGGKVITSPFCLHLRGSRAQGRPSISEAEGRQSCKHKRKRGGWKFGVFRKKKKEAGKQSLFQNIYLSCEFQGERNHHAPAISSYELPVGKEQTGLLGKRKRKR